MPIVFENLSKNGVFSNKEIAEIQQDFDSETELVDVIGKIVNNSKQETHIINNGIFQYEKEEMINFVAKCAKANAMSLIFPVLNYSADTTSFQENIEKAESTIFYLEHLINKKYDLDCEFSLENILSPSADDKAETANALRELANKIESA